MTDKEIIAFIGDYITNRLYHYAIMIDGGWGCGKTFFVENQLIPHLRNKGHDVNYISLFGVKNTDEIANILAMQALKDKMPKKAKQTIDSYSGQLASVAIASEFKSVLSYFNTSINLKEIVNKLPNYDNNVIIFDDLERCGCDVPLVLGFINNFVEHTNAKVIVVANEEEIGKWQLDSNPELQLLVALQDRLLIDVEDKTEKENKVLFGDQNKVDPNHYSLEKLSLRRNAIFNNNAQYLRMKEKVIGCTIRYEPDLKMVFAALIDGQIKNDLLKNVLNSQLNQLVDFAVKEDHKNIRTFQFFLEKINTVFSLIGDSYQILHISLVLYCYRVSIRHMKGKPPFNWGDNIFGIQSFSEEIFSADELLGFKFVDDLIQLGSFDKDEALSALKKCAEKSIEEGNLTNDPFQYIRQWYCSEDAEVKQWLAQITSKIENGIYSTLLYPDLLCQLCTIQSYNVFKTETSNAISSMEYYLRTVPADKIKPIEAEHVFIEGNAAKAYHEYFKNFSRIIAERIDDSKKNTYKKIIVECEFNWVEKLEKEMIKDKQVSGHSFVYWVSPELITDRLGQSNNHDLEAFRHLLRKMYKGSYCYELKSDDYEHLIQLLEKINETDTSDFGEVKKMLFSFIGKNLEEIISDLAPIDIDDDYDE